MWKKLDYIFLLVLIRFYYGALLAATGSVPPIVACISRAIRFLSASEMVTEAVVLLKFSLLHSIWYSSGDTDNSYIHTHLNISTMRVNFIIRVFFFGGKYGITFKRWWNSSNGHQIWEFPRMGITLLSWLYTARTNKLVVLLPLPLPLVVVVVDVEEANSRVKWEAYGGHTSSNNDERPN